MQQPCFRRLLQLGEYRVTFILPLLRSELLIIDDFVELSCPFDSRLSKGQKYC
jgi:hypothetical protein